MHFQLFLSPWPSWSRKSIYSLACHAQALKSDCLAEGPSGTQPSKFPKTLSWISRVRIFEPNQRDLQDIPRGRLVDLNIDRKSEVTDSLLSAVSENIVHDWWEGGNPPSLLAGLNLIKPAKEAGGGDPPN